jgi:hypothetical protein
LCIICIIVHHLLKQSQTNKDIQIKSYKQSQANIVKNQSQRPKSNALKDTQ